MKNILKLLNDNHWYIIGVTLAVLCIIWAYGCESRVGSMMNKGELVNRDELQAEADYLLAMFRTKASSLDRQDAVKQQLLDAANVLGQGGQINPSGILNLAASIGGISFGLSQRQKLNAYKKTTTTAPANGNQTNTA